ncbi:major capsid protein [Joostella sp.]|uniref:major capsid protein n=1 Tax=Joostella sp. TaxID=2231138 RepID=UPI003A8E3394
MATESLFKEYVDKWMDKLVLSVSNKINGKDGEPVYLHLTWLTKKYSPTLQWEALSGNGTTVAADVVSLDSELPLKLRDSLKTASGDVPKIGMKMYLNESQLQNIDIMKSRGGRENEIVAALFNDLQKCIYGVHERLEYMLLQALSTGVTTIANEGADQNNTGKGIRVDYGIPSENQFTVADLWTDVSSTPLDDIDIVLSKASGDGVAINTVKMDRVTFNNFKKTTQVKEAYASFAVGFIGQKTAVPTLDKVNEFLLSDKGFTIEIIDRSIKIERNGVRTSVKPWEEGRVTFLTSNNVGSLVYGDLAEENHPVEGVTYTKTSTFVLASKYSVTEPLQEFSRAMANVIPVLENVDQIYILDTKTETATS